MDFKIGDKVRITAAKDNIAEIKETVGYYLDMEDLFGKVGLVTGVSPRGNPEVAIGDDIYYWPPKFLEKEKKTRTAYLKAEKVMDRGEPKFKITGWEGILTEKELPSEYIDQGHPRFEHVDGSREIEINIVTRTEIVGVSGYQSHTTNPTYVHAIRVGDLISPEGFGNLLAEMKRCGERLTAINREIKKKEAEWVGPEKRYEI